MIRGLPGAPRILSGNTNIANSHSDIASKSKSGRSTSSSSHTREPQYTVEEERTSYNPKMPKRKIPSSARASPNGKSKPRPNVNPNRKAKTAATMMRRTTPKQFGRFKELPLEIRCMIWKLALPEGRVIEVLWNEEKGRFYTDAIQPVTLQVSTNIFMIF